MIPASSLNRRFTHHPPISESRAKAHESVRAACLNLAHVLNTLMPDGHEKNKAIDALDETQFWANAAIARHSI
ncbi:MULTISPECIES: Acb2/Tad1 domain-containing protein [Streptosporangium]|uniref:Acb2/Tad1 hairpin domain-containing protein n=1 Tax=Streptosporangium brasiliense TaxID=47480 RepID=A0ABT9RMP7_9ACTN|nr:hypothetical protein [Streptosporangium brasiliense]MDP9870353.1 hypothetical protein [Streptosporangium brasiliense]